jgi:hypothetical protein
MDYPLMIESGAAAVGTLTVRSPYDGRKLADAASGGSVHVDDALTSRDPQGQCPGPRLTAKLPPPRSPDLAATATFTMPFAACLGIAAPGR